ncbi:MAG: hypothetical protein JWL85_286 [Candidatus Saccharibacteria bacterium]|nr:hypothetical protein [Candidatus Saccharibacteria bacterium]
MSNMHFDGDTEATELYDQLRYDLDSVNGLDNLGPFALDVGGRNAGYVPLIKALGVQRVLVVDPDAEQLQHGIDQGLVTRADTFAGTLESWVEDEACEPADSAFVFNMQPSLLKNGEFLLALARSVKVGGFIVATFMEPVSAVELPSRIHSHLSDSLRIIESRQPVAVQRDFQLKPNAFTYILERI